MQKNTARLGCRARKGGTRVMISREDNDTPFPVFHKLLTPTGAPLDVVEHGFGHPVVMTVAATFDSVEGFVKSLVVDIGADSDALDLAHGGKVTGGKLLSAKPKNLYTALAMLKQMARSEKAPPSDLLGILPKDLPAPESVRCGYWASPVALFIWHPNLALVTACKRI